MNNSINVHVCNYKLIAFHFQFSLIINNEYLSLHLLFNNLLLQRLCFELLCQLPNQIVMMVHFNKKKKNYKGRFYYY